MTLKRKLKAGRLYDSDQSHTYELILVKNLDFNAHGQKTL